MVALCADLVQEKETLLMEVRRRRMSARSDRSSRFDVMSPC